MSSVKKKLLSCFYFSDVLCSFRKSKKVGIMNRCLKCPFYFKFMREMEEEEFWNFENNVRKYGWDFAERMERRD
jgi:hypothetical protein